MKKIKLRISELTNPELLSAETMKTLQGGAVCSSGTCYDQDGHMGTCGAQQELCACYVSGIGYGSVYECYA